MKTIRDYYYLYLKYVVSLLADVFEKIRNRCSENYCLCPSHYLSVPTLSLDPALSMTKVELDLFSDIDMYFLFEKVIRGSASYISKTQQSKQQSFTILCS